MTGRPKGFELSFPPAAAELAGLRRDVRQRLYRLGISEGTADAIVLVVDELVSNAIDHADEYRTTDTMLCVRLRRQEEQVLLEFVDPDVPTETVDELSRALASSKGVLPDLLSERGRGLFLVTHNLDQLEVRARPEGGMHLRGRFDGVV